MGDDFAEFMSPSNDLILQFTFIPWELVKLKKLDLYHFGYKDKVALKKFVKR